MPVKILIADDDKNICELLRLYLAKEGYEVCMANDGEAAFAGFEKEKPDLVLLDAVSYTHLDVSKRQGCRSRRTRPRAPPR